MIGAAVTASWASRCAVSLLSLLLSPPLNPSSLGYERSLPSHDFQA